MKITLKRTLARVLLPFLTLWMVFLPSRAYSIAFVPAAAAVLLEGEAAAATVSASIVIAEAVTGTSAGVLAAGAVATNAAASGFAATVGAAVMYFALHDNNGNAVRVPLVSPSKKPNAIPPPVAASNSSQESSYVMYMSSQASTSACGDSCRQATGGCSVEVGCQQFACSSGTVFVLNGGSCGGSPNCGQVVNASGGGCTIKVGSDKNGWSVYSYPTVPVLRCPSGYALSVNGNSCELVDARQAVADKKADFVRTPTGFASPSPDKDIAKGASANAELNLLLNASTISGGGGGGSVGGGSTWAITIKSPTGEPQVYELATRPDGGTTLKQSTQVTFANADTGVKTQTLQISPDGVIESAAQTTTTGQIESTSTPSGVVSTITQDKPVTQTSVNSSPTTINFPNDYARQGEAQTAAESLKTPLDKIGNALTTNVPNPDDPIPSTDFASYGDTFAYLRGFRLPPHASSCPRPVIDLSILGPGQSITLNAHCSIVSQYTDALLASSSVAWVGLALFIILRA